MATEDYLHNRLAVRLAGNLISTVMEDGHNQGGVVPHAKENGQSVGLAGANAQQNAGEPAGFCQVESRFVVGLVRDFRARGPKGR